MGKEKVLLAFFASRILKSCGLEGDGFGVVGDEGLFLEFAESGGDNDEIVFIGIVGLSVHVSL